MPKATDERLAEMTEAAEKVLLHLKADVNALRTWVDEAEITDDQQEELKSLLIWMGNHATWLEQDIDSATSD